jgi:anaerobic ribonucleoside-triphosphate reductase
MQEYCQMHNQYYPQDVKAVLARAPAEEVAGRFARLDATMGVAISDGRYYSNGFQAFSEDLTVLDTVRIESKLWPYVNGGSITQIYLKESNPNAQALWRFTRNVAKTSNIKYLVYNISYAICEKCFAKTSQLVTECSCGSKDLTWIARVTGYMSVAAVIRNGEIIRQWNVGKWHEFGDRPQQSINKVLEAYK